MKAMPDNTLGNDGLGKEFNKVFLELTEKYLKFSCRSKLITGKKFIQNWKPISS